MTFNVFKDTVIKNIIGPLWAIIKPAILVLGSQSGQLALALATKFVAEAATNPDLLAKGGSARAQWVQVQVKHASVQSGSPLADSIINLAIEVALQQYKAKNS